VHRIPSQSSMPSPLESDADRVRDKYSVVNIAYDVVNL
jgi:hypothetical protein